jgi:hypothetical protein
MEGTRGKNKNKNIDQISIPITLSQNNGNP